MQRLDERPRAVVGGALLHHLVLARLGRVDHGSLGALGRVVWQAAALGATWALDTEALQIARVSGAPPWYSPAWFPRPLPVLRF